MGGFLLNRKIRGFVYGKYYYSASSIRFSVKGKPREILHLFKGFALENVVVPLTATIGGICFWFCASQIGGKNRDNRICPNFREARSSKNVGAFSLQDYWHPWYILCIYSLILCITKTDRVSIAQTSAIVNDNMWLHLFIGGHVPVGRFSASFSASTRLHPPSHSPLQSTEHAHIIQCFWFNFNFGLQYNRKNAR